MIKLPSLAKKYLYSFILIIIVILIARYFFSRIQAEQIKAFILSFGVLTPLVFVLLTASTTVFSFIIAAPFWIAGMWIFGLFQGAILIHIGNVLGQTLNYLIVKKWGKRIIIRLSGQGTLEKVERLFSIIDYKTFTIMRILGGPPMDILSYASGLTKLKLLPYFLITFFAIIPNTIIGILTFYYVTFTTDTLRITIFTSLSVVLYTIAILYPLYIYKKKLHKKWNLQ